MTRSHRLSPLAAACLMCLATGALAQETVLQRVEVTGSNIKRTDLETATPVQVLKRSDLEKLGASTVAEALAQVSANTSGFDDIGGSNSFASGSSAVSLRNLGKQSTLLLVNFRRVAPFPLADYNEVFSNIDALPLDAVDRIEILKSGGAAIYGSDAVAGVINIITRSDYQGLQAGTSYKQASKTGKFRETTATLTGGVGDLVRDGYNVLANVEFFKRQDLPSWRTLLSDLNPAYAAKSKGFGSFSTYSYPGNVIGVGPVAGCETVISNLCRYDRYQRFEVQPGADRANGMVAAHYKPSAELDGYTELLFSHVKTSYTSPFQTYGAASAPAVWGDPRTGNPITFTYRGLPAQHPLNPTGDEVEFRYRFVDGPSEQSVATNQYRLLSGVKGVWRGMDWDTAVGVMGGNTDFKQRGSFSNSGFIATIGDYNADTLAADFFNKKGGYQIGKTNSADVLNQLFPQYGYKGKARQLFWDAKLSGDIGQFMDGPLSLATGVELRRESFAITPSDKLATGDIVGNGVSSSDASRNFGAAFAELSMTPVKALEVQTAARVDKFPGFGAHISPKIGIRFQPMQELLLRATAETGFRAPNLTESAPSLKFSFAPGVSDPKRCAQTNALATDLQTQAAALPDSDPNKALLQARADNIVGQECGTSIANAVRNNPALKPETSRSINFGLVFEPVRGYSISADVWSIERKSEIGTRSVDDLLAQEANLAPGTVVRGSLANDPTFISAAERAKYGVTVGKLVSINGEFENLGKTKTSGLDLGGQASVTTEYGKLGYVLDAVYLASFKQFSQTLKAYGDNLAGRYGYSKWTTSQTLTFSHAGGFTHALRYTWQQGTTLNTDYFDDQWTIDGCKGYGLSADECKLGAYQRWDYNLSYTGVKDLTLGFNIRNLTNRRPPVDWRSFGGNSGLVPSSGVTGWILDDVKGRVYRITAQYKFW